MVVWWGDAAVYRDANGSVEGLGRSVEVFSHCGLAGDQCWGGEMIFFDVVNDGGVECLLLAVVE